MLGYPYCEKGYKVWDLENRKIFISRDVFFTENIFPFLLKKESHDFMSCLRQNLSKFEIENDDFFNTLTEVIVQENDQTETHEEEVGNEEFIEEHEP